jgi:arylsulfatase A-like enzyme
MLPALLLLLSMLCTAHGSASGAAPGTFPGSAPGAASPAQHVLWIVVDDMGFSDLSYKTAMYNSSGPGFSTPTLDALAATGVKLESYYVHALCSPSRTAFMSGRYAFNIGMNAEVIVDGVPDTMPTNIRTVADLLQSKGWVNGAFGKMDLGMTTWGCTPNCRGFNRFVGFYGADEDYFTHATDGGVDFRSDFEPLQAAGNYSTDVIRDAVVDWVANTTAAGAQHTFNYVAFQAIHAPQQAPQEYLDGHCTDAIPEDQPIRRLACAQMAGVDAAVAAIMAAYDKAGLTDSTFIVFTTDNGGNPDTGGNNYPLRGMKASLYEGGLRGAAFVAGAGLSPSVRGTVSHELYSLVDWLPTIAGGIAGVDLAQAEVPRYPYQPPPPPLDGMDMLASLSTGSPSPRTSALLYLDPLSCFSAPSPCAVPGQGAIRVGRYKLLHGHIGQYMSPTTNVSAAFCGARDGVAQGGTRPLPVPPGHTPSFCPSGWVNPPGSPTLPAVQPPPGVPSCPDPLPPGAGCRLPPEHPLLAGGTWLYDVVADPSERTDLAPSQPELVAQLLALLAGYNNSGPPQAHSPSDPAAAPGLHGGFWTPWRGDPVPQHCDPNATAPPALHAALDGLEEDGGGAECEGLGLEPQRWRWRAGAPECHPGHGQWRGRAGHCAVRAAEAPPGEQHRGA